MTQRVSSGVTARHRDEVTQYFAAVRRLDALIDPVGPADRSLAAIQARAAEKLARAREFLAYLGKPQRAYPIVHVTGTSGKGSTCAAVAAMTSRAGYRTGLATSPYLQVATEKLQIDAQLIAAADFADLVDETLEAASRWEALARLDRPLTYGEVWIALTTGWFARQQVDLAVMEVGAGGRFDVTNLVEPVVTVVTSVGLDHTATLGSTIEQIAWHKAGVFKPGAVAITAATDPVALAVLRRVAASLGVSLTEVDPAHDLEILAAEPGELAWRLYEGSGRPSSPVYRSRGAGRYQATNGAVAIQVVEALGQLGFSVPEDARRAGLLAAALPGRSEQMPSRSAAPEPRVIIDAAHNPDKMRAFFASLPNLIGGEDRTRVKPVLLTGALAGKDAPAMLSGLLEEVSAVVTTAAGVRGKEPLAAAGLADLVKATGFAGPVVAHEDVATALAAAIAQARELNVPLVVTGSMFLGGQVRSHWYPADAILRQRTPWPGLPARGA